MKIPRLTPNASSSPTTISPRLIAAPRRPALDEQEAAPVVVRAAAGARRAVHASARPRSRTSSSVAPIQSSAGAKNMYTDSDSVGFESGLTTAEKPVLAVSQ